MIHVLERSKPPSFDTLVGIPGQAYLAANPVSKKNEQWEAHWRECLPELAIKYKNICAYYGCHVGETTGASSVDHYHPKSKRRDLAYDWSNYRFACSRMNARKHNNRNVLDPFKVVDGWFVLDFGLMSVHPNFLLPKPIRDQVLTTRERLDLNSSECIRERSRLWDNYDQNGDSIKTLYQCAPFIALEAVRQGKLRPADSGITAANIRTWLDS